MRNKRILTGVNINLADSNGMWRGDEVGLISLHEWVAKRIPKPEVCPKCSLRPVIDLANKGVYDRNLANWEWLCRKCHMLSDGRLERFLSHSRARKVPNQKCLNCNKVFAPGKNGRKYCSLSCSRPHTNKGKTKQLKCVSCGKTFVGYPAKRSCSERCLRDRRNYLERVRRKNCTKRGND